MLLKPEVGKPKQVTRDLPAKEHIYGKRNNPDIYNAGALLTSWMTH